ncbi:mavicyanin-like [Salvia miltiorrhiza]|uniref:mavicyanin-like n=1 Tax=Salvia miltiorrhiza TaxID=226208 RepID=UPI0025ABE194|nr:mavicyanin-like [Salvia miltiorrhiza]
MDSILEKRSLAVFLFLISTLSHLSFGAVHKVGDSAGWTTIANVDYKQWAISKSFQIGDIIVFEYNSQFHNVMRVTHAEYKTCNVSSPITTHTSGNDSIAIDTRGHHFFVCGVPGHCQAGQKVDINVPRAPSVAPSPSGSASASASPAPPLAAGAPAPSSGASLSALSVPFDQLGYMLLLQLACIVGGLF